MSATPDASCAPAAAAQPVAATLAVAAAAAAAAAALALATTALAFAATIAAARPFCGRAVHRKYPRRPLQGHAQDQGAPSALTHAYMPTHQCAPDGHTEKC